MPVDAVAMLKNLIGDILHNHDAAAQFAADPTGTLAAQGVTEGDLSGVDMRQLVSEACSSPAVPAETRSALQSYTSGGGSSSGGYSAPGSSSGSSMDQVVQHLNYVTYETYKDDHSITQTILDSSTHVDNSTNLDVAGDVHGDIDVDTNNATALGDGSVAGNTDGGDLNAATGDHAQVIDGDNFGQANTGDGAVQVGGSNSGAINTGVNTGVIAGDDVDHTVVGDHNQTVQTDGDTDGSVFNFGHGDVSNINDSDVRDSAVSAGGNATNTSDNSADHGSAISGSGSGDARGNFEDNDTTTTTVDSNNDSHDDTRIDTHVDTHVETNEVHADHSVVGTEQGPGDQHQDTHIEEEHGHGGPLHEVHDIPAL
jgi:hypothetical protein